MNTVGFSHSGILRNHERFGSSGFGKNGRRSNRSFSSSRSGNGFRNCGFGFKNSGDTGFNSGDIGFKKSSGFRSNGDGRFKSSNNSGFGSGDSKGSGFRNDDSGFRSNGNSSGVNGSSSSITNTEAAEESAFLLKEQAKIKIVQPVIKQVSQVSRAIGLDEDDENESEDEFEAYRTSELPEFRGTKGLDNFQILQQEQGSLSAAYDLYTFMMKQRFPGFLTAMLSAPIMLSMFFTLLYLPAFEELALNSQPFQDLTWSTIFQIFMFSMSLCTGLEPEVAPISPYTLVVANVNALMAQLLFVFLSGAVFARLSQPSLPIKCSTVAIISRAKSGRKPCRVLMVRYVLSGPQPSELVDVKVELTYKFNALTTSGSFFRGTHSLKLIRRGTFYLNHGMLVRHVIDEQSPLYRRTPDMLKREDAVISLSVVGLERSSMQPVFHVQHYCAYDGQIVWDAEFEDMILINKKNVRIVDHSRLSSWKSLGSASSSRSSGLEL